MGGEGMEPEEEAEGEVAEGGGIPWHGAWRNVEIRSDQIHRCPAWRDKVDSGPAMACTVTANIAEHCLWEVAPFFAEILQGNVSRWLDRSGRWVAGSLGHWVIGSLGRWVAGLLGCWVTGLLGRWVAGSLGRRVIGSLGHWVAGSLGR